ncbi:MAG TPA: glycerol-3-phosphate acyltransferase [Anaerolineales bacterium]|nr:glycerol-3-phosphate acyltransferase [Anaerolineales bacterium]
MPILIGASVLLLAYILGSIPFGLLIVKLSTGKDIRQVASGRMGGTNAGRAAGLWAGLLTTFLDGAKATIAVWISIGVAPQNHWLHALAGIAAIVGHNYSLFIMERDERGHIHLHGGAGGGPTVGGAIGLWWPSAFIILPVAALVFVGIGYASVTTISVAVTAIVVFGVRYYLGLSPFADVFYGIVALLLLLWALRPNIRALIEGRERFHGWRPWHKHKPDDNKAPGGT